MRKLLFFFLTVGAGFAGGALVSLLVNILYENEVDIGSFFPMLFAGLAAVYYIILLLVSMFQKRGER